MTSELKSLTPKKVIGYCRVSSASQEDNTSLDYQEQQIQMYCDRKGYSIFHIYREVESGSSVEGRPQLQAAIDAILKNYSDALAVVKPDRLARNTVDALTIANKLTQASKVLLFTELDIDTSTPTGWLHYSMLSMFSQYEREVINQRSKQGVTSLLQRLEYPYSNPPYGYTIDKNKKLNINEHEYAMVMLVKHWRSQRIPLRVCADKLNAIGLYRRCGKPWQTDNLWHMLNSAKKGLYDQYLGYNSP